MILLNKFLRIRDPYVGIKDDRYYKFSWPGKRGWAKFSVKMDMVGPVIWNNYNNIVATHFKQDPLCVNITLFLERTDFVEIDKYENEVVHLKTRATPHKNYNFISFNIKSYLAWKRYKKGPFYRKKILQWI